MPHTFTLTIDGQEFHCVSFLEPGDVPATGVPVTTIVGRVPVGVEMSPATIEMNPDFVTFMHDTIGAWGPAVPVLEAAAVQQRTGWLYVLDMRTPAGKPVTAEDLIGVFAVEDGVIAPGSYRSNATWRALTDTGMFRFPAWLRQLLQGHLPAA